MVLLKNDTKKKHKLVDDCKRHSNISKNEKRPTVQSKTTKITKSRYLKKKTRLEKITQAWKIYGKIKKARRKKPNIGNAHKQDYYGVDEGASQLSKKTQIR